MLRALSLGPDTVFRNASGMITMEDPVRLDRELTALAVQDGRIIALGPDAALSRMAQGAAVVDLEGAVVMPGLVDCHNHFLSTALGWERVQLAAARSIGEVLEAIAQRVRETPPGQWVLCASRWHETNLAERRLPTAAELDRVAPQHPVYLPRGGHVVVTNTTGLQMAGILPDAANPPGGELVRDASGRLTGMLLERPAFARLTSLLPAPTEDERRTALQAGIRAYNGVGITAIREPGLTATDVRSYQAVIPQVQALRASLMWRMDLSTTPEQRQAWLQGLAPISGFGNQWLDIWGLKVLLDGGVEGGYFHEPYANNPQFRGFPFVTQEHLAALVEQAHGLGWRVGVHVVGDAAMEMVLDAFQTVNTHSRTYDRGHALEHAFSPIPGAIERTRDLGIGVTLQHALVYSLAGNMQSYWGQQRATDCTPARAWLDSGVLIGAGTDSPVTNYDPWLNIYGFATRDTQVAGVLGPQHRIAVAEALYAYTVGSAQILGWDKALGRLAPGMAADFICLDRDPLAVPLDQVRYTQVTRTVVQGRQVFPA
ncbi:MAG TPA: amidohydrolase [Candidatus Tectomicrobia bacterium]